MKQIFFIFLNIIIPNFLFAQALTKYGQITSTGSTYVNANGAIGTSTGVNKNGQIVISNPLAVLTSTAASAVTGTKATSGGNITSIGSSAIIDCGVCWNTSVNPTISNSKTSNGALGVGSFSTNLTGLAQTTTYYMRAYATNSGGTSYGQELSFTTTAIQVGDSYQGGVIFYFFVSGDLGYIAGQTHGLIASLTELGSKELSCGDTNIPGTSPAIGYGAQSTAALVAACPAETNSGSYLCANLVQNGYSDWYLPTQGEYNRLFSVSASIGIGLGSRHWTSTQDPNAGWEVNGIFMQANGSWGTTSKWNPYNIRPVRSF